VEMSDGATLAQLSLPDMRLPIGYALSYPGRLGTPFGAIDWARLNRLEFESPDRPGRPGPGRERQPGRAGGTAPACLNGANEVAVEAFLSGRLRWTEIDQVIDETLAGHRVAEPATVDDVLLADADARRAARAAVERRVRVA